MVKLIGHLHESLCNKFMIFTLENGKDAHLVSQPHVQAKAVPTLREVMEHKYRAEVASNAPDIGKPTRKMVIFPRSA